MGISCGIAILNGRTAGNVDNNMKQKASVIPNI